jgi:hypothetical protein
VQAITGGNGSTAHNLAFLTCTTGGTPTERLYISSAGLVGIGVTGPSELLHVNGNAIIEDRLLLQRLQSSDNLSVLTFSDTLTGSKGNNLSIGNPGGYDVLLHTGGVEKARLTSDGKFLVGTSTSITGVNAQYGKLQSIGNTFATPGNGIMALGRSEAATSITTDEGIGAIYFTDNAGGEFALISCAADGTAGTNDYPGRLVFSTTADGASSPTEQMRITSAGSVYIGAAEDPSATVGGAGFSQSTNSRRILRLSTLTASANNLVQLFNPNGQVGDITVSGTSTAYNTSSDYRLKENVVPLIGAINRVTQLQVHRFNFIADPDKTVDGFIAHEAQAVVPECVTGIKDAVDDDGNPVYQGIDQSKLVPLLTAALQEAIGRIETLEAEVTALKAS